MMNDNNKKQSAPSKKYEPEFSGIYDVSVSLKTIHSARTIHRMFFLFQLTQGEGNLLHNDLIRNRKQVQKSDNGGEGGGGFWERGTVNVSYCRVIGKLGEGVKRVLRTRVVRDHG